MATEVKLGLSRARLFSTENCVCFYGKYKEVFDEKRLSKSLAALAQKEPLITAAAELFENGEAYIITDKIIPAVEAFSGELLQIVSDCRAEGFDFSKRLFRFALINGDVLAVFSHTAVSDVKSLFILAEALIAFYEKTSLSVEPDTIRLFSSKEELPAAVFSPLTDKITSELDEKWLKKASSFSYEDYCAARESHNKNKSSEALYTFVLSQKETSDLKARMNELSADVTTAVAFAFKKVLSARYKLPKKNMKLIADADERLYMDCPGDYSVGPFNGSVTLLKQRKKEVKSYGEFVAFHRDYYRKNSNPYNAFYSDYFLMCLSPFLCDSAYMCEAGVYKNKRSLKFAKNYSCMNKKLLHFHAYNLEQIYWNGLSCFSDIAAIEPFLTSDMFSATAIFLGGTLRISLEYRPSECSDETAISVCDEVKKVLLGI